VGKNFQDFIILLCGQPNLEPQSTICNFKKLHMNFKKSFKTGKSFFYKGKKVLPVFNEN
jgi:hypothetical protein